MGCVCSKSTTGSATPVAPAHRPVSLPLQAPLPPTPPTIERKRKASGPYLESPYRKWQRRQMSHLHGSPDGTPTKARPSSPQDPPPTPPPKEYPSSVSRYSNHPQGCSYDQEPLPGTAIPYQPSSEASPQQASSVYPESPVTPSPHLPRSHSYRSSSGKLMYSPVRFPLESSPYGTPTIRKVTRSSANLLDVADNTAKDEEVRHEQEQTVQDVVRAFNQDDVPSGSGAHDDKEEDRQKAEARAMTVPSEGERSEPARVPLNDGTGRWKWAFE